MSPTPEAPTPEALALTEKVNKIKNLGSVALLYEQAKKIDMLDSEGVDKEVLFLAVVDQIQVLQSDNTEDLLELVVEAPGVDYLATHLQTAIREAALLKISAEDLKTIANEVDSRKKEIAEDKE